MIKYFRTLETLSTYVNNKYTKLFEMNINNNYFDIIFAKYRIIILERESINTIFIRIEKLDSMLLGNIFCPVSRLIGSIDIKYDKDKLKILDYIINSKYFEILNNNIFGPALNINDKKKIQDIIFNFATNLAINNNFDKIELIVHKNLKYYENDDLESYGFIITNKTLFNNNDWLITEKYIHCY